MAVLSDDMGGITAYAAAVNRGYTGTKEEFEQLMYSYTEVAERAEAAAGNAHESEEATIEAKDIAVSAKNEAVSARDAAASARDASVSAKNDSESARDSAISAKDDTLAAKDAVMDAKSDVDETSANFSEAVTVAISDVNAAGRNQKELAKTHAVDSEAWAVGQREGADVGVSDTTYHNNSKYYAEQSAIAKDDSVSAKNAAESAKADAISAKNQAETARGQAQDIVDGINAKSEQIDQNAEDISALQTAMETKAEIDGYYEDMTVGDAEQLVSSKYVEDSEPYLYRTSGGSKDIGNREYVDAIVGGTVNWNQLVQNANKSASFVTNEAGYSLRALQTMTLYADTVYLLNIDANVSSNGTWRYRYPQVGIDLVTSDTSIIKTSANSQLNTFAIQIFSRDGQDATFDFDNIMLIDLTAMFGSTIADYIYSLEQTTTGAGVAWFKKLFPNDYYEYNAGELKSVESVSAHEMVGFNMWDEEWEVGGIIATTGQNDSANVGIRSKNYIPIIPDTRYYNYFGSTATGYNFQTRFYDGNKNYIGYTQKNGNSVAKNATFVTPSNARFMRFQVQTEYGLVYNHNICINLSWSGWRDGEYEPYVKHSYPLDSSLTLRGIPKLDANNNLYYDGDRYLPDGTVERRYGIVDLGTLTWGYVTDDSFAGAPYFATGSTNKLIGSANLICDKYIAAINRSQIQDKVITQFNATNSSAIVVRDDTYTDATAFKAAMSGVMLVYELAEPITESAEPYAEIQICDDFGTEEYVSTGIVPVGHETRYPANLRDKLQHLPDLADDDGYYMISQQNKNMSLELFRIPKAPTTDGAYTLKATVSGGTPTYTWEAEE